MPRSVPFEFRQGGFCLIKVRENTFVDYVEALSQPAYVSSMGHVRIRAKSPFDILLWKKILEITLTYICLDGIIFGVTIGYNGSQMSQECDN